jgi:hypothetical protein
MPRLTLDYDRLDAVGGQLIDRLARRVRASGLQLAGGALQVRRCRHQTPELLVGQEAGQPRLVGDRDRAGQRPQPAKQLAVVRSQSALDQLPVSPTNPRATTALGVRIQPDTRALTDHQGLHQGGLTSDDTHTGTGTQHAEYRNPPQGPPRVVDHFRPFTAPGRSPVDEEPVRVERPQGNEDERP